MHALVSAPFCRWFHLRERYGAALLERLIAGGWLVPCVRQHRFSIYSAECVAAVDARLKAGEMPPPYRRVKMAKTDRGEVRNAL